LGAQRPLAADLVPQRNLELGGHPLDLCCGKRIRQRPSDEQICAPPITREHRAIDRTNYQVMIHGQHADIWQQRERLTGDGPRITER
jgi:hypothetical protein